MVNLKEWLILTLALVIMVLMLKGCFMKPVVSEEPIPGIEYVHDTIFAKDTVIEFKKKYYPKWDSVLRIDTVFSCNQLKMDRLYNDTASDKNIDIFNRSEVTGILKSLKVSYKLKVPLIIKDSITITNVVYRPSKVSIYSGLELSGNKSNFNLSPFVSAGINKTIISVRYGILDKTFGIGVGYKIFSSSK